MKLLAKFNLILLVALGTAGVAISTIAYFFLLDNARHQVLQQADLMMASATSMRTYTDREISPLLQQNPMYLKRFLPETVPAFAATTIFRDLRKTHPDYTYKEATLNPTNLADRAADWEADVINDLRAHPDVTRVVGERDGATGRALYLAVPITVTADCLQCHSTPAAAPRTVIAAYGPDHGFGWKIGERVGAQMVNVPLVVPIKLANEAFGRLLISFALALLLTIAVLDAGAYFLVIRPLRMVAEAADRVSTGDRTVPDIKVGGNDEIAVVTGAFNRMRMSLAKALSMLDE